MNTNGSIRRLICRDVALNLFVGNEIEGGPTNIYLRHLGENAEAIGLLGPRSPSIISFNRTAMTLTCQWRGIHVVSTFVVSDSAPAWFFHLELENRRATAAELDLIYVQDLALSDYGAARSNEYYVSQYVDHTPLSHPDKGVVICSRQNQNVGGRHPWCAIGSLRRGVNFATDAIDFNGLSTRAGNAPSALIAGLTGRRLQHEHSLAAIQDAPIRLAPEQRIEAGFFGWFEQDHPSATFDRDLQLINLALTLPEAKNVAPVPGKEDASVLPQSLFCSAPLLNSLELSEAEITGIFGNELRQAEREDGRLLSFFCPGNAHVVLKEKELKTLRPHGLILRTGSRLSPDEASLTTTVWMSGIFNSMLTQGHVSANRFISANRGYLSLFRSHGQRMFIDIGGCWQLLDEPSAFEMTPSGCRWFYKCNAGLFIVEIRASTARHELQLTVERRSGPPLRVLLSSHIAINGDDGADETTLRYESDDRGVFIRPIPDCDIGRRFPDGGLRIELVPGAELERIAGDDGLFPDSVTRNQSFICLIAKAPNLVGFRIFGCLIPTQPQTNVEPDRYWKGASNGLQIHAPINSALAGDAARLGEIFPWFLQNALIHYMAPRGLEQFSVGDWGTRDVAQGPFEMLLALGRIDCLRGLLIHMFRQQQPNGDWPQWFGVFERDRNNRAEASHGDIIFWPILALAKYLSASRDVSILNEKVVFFSNNIEAAERETVQDHIDRALALINSRVVSGTHLAAYGHGDWNDTLQPVDNSMKEHLCSAWTATLHYQTLEALGEAYFSVGLTTKAAEYRASANNVLQDFRRLLIVDGVLSGMALFRDKDEPVEHLLHPQDTRTGISYSLIPIIHAIIGGLFTPAQAREHLDIVRHHLAGPDGARLFDWPIRYNGGPQTFFQRAESSSFFGREIGLMYTHAHLRYAEALWRYGAVEDFFHALCQANPIGVQKLTPSATLRQANCYYSSSDATFTDRYEAFESYDKALQGLVPTEGGWRVYSSGPGIFVRLILSCFLGLQQEKEALILDPAIPPRLDKLRVEVELYGIPFDVTYNVTRIGCGPVNVRLNGTDLPFYRIENPYRLGAASIPIEAVFRGITDSANRLCIDLA